MEDDDAEEDEDEGEDVEEDEDEDVNAEDEVEEDKVQDDDVEEEEDDDVGHDDVEEEDRSQDLGPHFVRACAVKMHVKSTYHKGHFIQKFTGKRRETRVSTLIKHRPLLLP